MEEKYIRIDSNVQENTVPIAKIISLQSQTEQMLYNATLMTEMALDIKDKCSSSEKYVTHLKNFAIRACKTVNSIQNTSKAFLVLAQKLTLSAVRLLDNLPTNDQKLCIIRFEYEKLLTILEREIAEMEDIEAIDYAVNQSLIEVNMKTISDKIRNLEDRQKWNESYVHSSNSNRSFKSDIDEKYPDKLTKESIMDLDNVVNLPSVPEDIFTTFTRPKRTSSLSSLKNLRKVKLFLQRAESNSDDDEDWEENSISSQQGIGDCDPKERDKEKEREKELEKRNSGVKNASLLGDIEEEI